MIRRPPGSTLFPYTTLSDLEFEFNEIMSRLDSIRPKFDSTRLVCSPIDNYLTEAHIQLLVYQKLPSPFALPIPD